LERHSLMIKNDIEFDNENHEFTDWLKSIKNIDFQEGLVAYTLYHSCVVIQAEPLSHYEPLEYTFLHELGHFVSMKIERTLLNNYGFKPGFDGSTKKSLENEMKAIEISLCLGREFSLPELSAQAIINTLLPMKYWVNLPESSRAEVLGQIYINYLKNTKDYTQVVHNRDKNLGDHFPLC